MSRQRSKTTMSKIATAGQQIVSATGHAVEATAQGAQRAVSATGHAVVATAQAGQRAASAAGHVAVETGHAGKRAVIAHAPAALMTTAALHGRDHAQGKTTDSQYALQQKTDQLTTPEQLSRENMLSLIKLRGQKLDSPGTGELDVNIHGTTARRKQFGTSWVDKGSAFSRAEGGARVRNVTDFQWTGGGSEEDRVTAGESLGNFLNDVKNPAIMGADADINAIAHSHGGNVLGKALSEEGTTGIKSAVMLGTPMMTRSGTNTSWSTAAADKVSGQIHSFSDPDDKIQTTGARLNEYAKLNVNPLKGADRLQVGRTFASPSTTPQHNISVESGRSKREKLKPTTGAKAHSELHKAPIGREVYSALLEPRASGSTSTTKPVDRRKL